jgi:hypothetical protein
VNELKNNNPLNTAQAKELKDLEAENILLEKLIKLKKREEQGLWAGCREEAQKVYNSVLGGSKDNKLTRDIDFYTEQKQAARVMNFWSLTKTICSILWIF